MESAAVSSSWTSPWCNTCVCVTVNALSVGIFNARLDSKWQHLFPEVLPFNSLLLHVLLSRDYVSPHPVMSLYIGFTAPITDRPWDQHSNWKEITLKILQTRGQTERTWKGFLATNKQSGCLSRSAVQYVNKAFSGCMNIQALYPGGDSQTAADEFPRMLNVIVTTSGNSLPRHCLRDAFLHNLTSLQYRRALHLSVKILRRRLSSTTIQRCNLFALVNHVRVFPKSINYIKRVGHWQLVKQNIKGAINTL